MTLQGQTTEMEPTRNEQAFVFDPVGLVILDFDGVVADSEIISLSSLKEALGSFGLELSLEDVRRQFLGKSLGSVMEFIAQNEPTRSAQDFPSVWQENLFSQFRSDLSPISGVTDFLQYLSDSGIPFCIASSGTFERISIALEAMKLQNWFGSIFSAELVANGKPAPDLFLMAASEMGVPPEHCLVLEDSPYGIRAAKAAGMQPCGFVGGQHLSDIQQAHSALLRDQGAVAIFSAYPDLAPAIRSVANA